MAVINETISEEYGIDISILEQLSAKQIEKEPVDEPIKENVISPLPTVKRRVLRSKFCRGVKNRSKFQVNKRDEHKDRLISIVNVDEYHANIVTEDNIQQLIFLSKKIQRSQLCGFDFDSRCYFVAVWLTTSRIFEYIPEADSYYEVKRIPLRYIDIHEKLITSVHLCDTKLYIAYISDMKDSAAYVEIRNLTSKLISKPHRYDRIITSIESDQRFIYIRTLGNILHLHNKNHFELMHYRVDFDIMSPSRVVSSTAQLISTNPYTKLELYTATETSFIVSELDALQHSVKQVYKLDDSYRTISAHIDSPKLFLHRNLIDSKTGLSPRSKLDIGVILSIEGERYFVHERCVNFTHEIIQVEKFEDRVFLFGCSKGRYEVGSLRASDFKPIWSSELKDVDHNCKIIAKQNHVIVFKGNHEHLVVKIDDYLSNDGIMSEFKTELNSNLETPHE